MPVPHHDFVVTNVRNCAAVLHLSFVGWHTVLALQVAGMEGATVEQAAPLVSKLI